MLQTKLSQAGNFVHASHRFCRLSPVALRILPAAAQNGAPDSEGGRYSFNRVDDGYLRLDQQTGQVSLCNRRSVGWACYPMPDERAALEEEIGRLQKDNAALEKGDAGARHRRCPA